MNPRLYAELFATEVRRRMSYRMDFWVTTVLNFIAALVIPWFFWGAVYAGSDRPALQGYRLDDMLLYVCAAVLVGRLVRGVEHAQDIAEDIYEGSLNRYLLYPAGYLGMKYTQHLGALLPHLLQVFLFLPPVVWLLGGGGTIGPGSLLMALPLILLANLLYYLIIFPMQGVAFWADNVWSLVVMTRMVSGLLGGAMVPLALFPDRAETVLGWLPFACLYDLPIRTLLGRVGPAEWLHGMGLAAAWCAVLYGAGRLVWRKGEQGYTGVGI